MRLLLNTFMASAAVVLIAGPPAVAQSPMPQSPASNAQAPLGVFVHSGVARDAERYAAAVRAGWKPGNRKAPDLIEQGGKALATDPRTATGLFAQAVVTDERSADAWLGLARALLAVKPDTDKGSERYDLPVNASASAYIAYSRARDPSAKAEALGVLAEALIRRNYWRPALEAMKASLALSENPGLRATFDKARAEHGFRMMDYKTEADAANPRVCLQFSEALSRSVGDFSKFVSLDGKDPVSLTAEDRQICLEGLAHGQRYEVALRAGLPSDVGEVLEKAATMAVYVPDRRPFVRFGGRNYVLPSRGQQGIPVVTVNTNRIAVEVYRVGDRSLASLVQSGEMQRNLSSGDTEALRDRTGTSIYKGEMDVALKLNEEVTTAFPISEAIPKLAPGAYAMIARAADRSGDGELATQWFVVSDLGLTALSGEDGVYGFVRALSSATAVAGARVRLIARNNEVLGTAVSDANGTVHFAGGLARGEGGQAPALLVAELGNTTDGNGEYAFLDLTQSAFDLSDRGVKGREAPGPLDAYMFAERGVYRPGESVYLTALVRDRAGTAASLPVTLILTRPDGVEHQRVTLTDGGLGGRSTTLALSGSAMTGTWRAKIYADPKGEPIAQAAFLVEDFVPERLDMTLMAEPGAMHPEQPFKIAASGRYLYGPPAADLGLEGDIVVKPSGKDVEGYAGYRFGLAEEKVNPARRDIDGAVRTKPDGSAELAVELPPIARTAKPLEAIVHVRLREPGGRTVERSVTVPVDLGLARIGVKPLFNTDNAPESGSAGFEVVLLDGSGKRTAAKAVAWTLYRLETTWQWYSHDGTLAFEPVTLSRKAASGSLDTGTDAPARIEAAIGYGRYRLDVASAESSGPATSVTFNAGWFAAPDKADTPEALDIALDKATYNPGDTAKLRISTRANGRALISVLNNGLVATREVGVEKGATEVAIPVEEGWGPGVYVTAMLYRPMIESEKRMPSRAIGIKWLAMDQSAQTLKVALTPPEKIRAADGLSVPVEIGGLVPGEEARVVVSAVDAGILSLTRYQVPAPGQWFNQQRQLALELRDFYGRLIDGMHAERGALRSGGDGGSGEAIAMDGSPPVEATVALSSGIVTVGPDGKAKVDLALPSFNGTVRVMAVAWSKTKTGHASRDVIVRDPVALTIAAPRFLTLGDEVAMGVSVHDIEGPEGQYKVSMTGLGGPGAQDLALKPGERHGVAMTLKPAGIGRTGADITVSGPGGLSVTRHLDFDVKPPAGDVKRTTVAGLPGHGGKITLNADLLTDMIPSRTRVTLSVGPSATLDVPGVLAQLDRYPYGCAEQTVSRALPLVYANALATELGMGADPAIHARVQTAIDRVLEMQDASGAFGLWGPSSTDMWLSSYVTDFLGRAKEKGYTVKPQAFAQALERLHNFVAFAQDFPNGGEARAYALYVLARNGRAPVGELRYYADTKLEKFATPLAKAQLGAALAEVGDKERAEAVFRTAFASLDAKSQDIARTDFGSDLRDGAGLLTLASEMGIAKAETPKLAGIVAKAYLARGVTSTQEQAWMLMAAHAIGEEAKKTVLTIDGQTVPGGLRRNLPAEALKDHPVVVTNEGEDTTDALITVVGAALTPEPPVAKGFKIARRYYTLDGKPVDLASGNGGSSQIAQNERLVTVVTVESREAGGRVLVVDRLPAGFEIENPRLVDGGDIKALEWLKSSAKPEHTEFRDDRFVAAFNFTGGKRAAGDAEADDGDTAAAEDQAAADPEASPATVAANAGKGSNASVAYIVRAVTPGTFVHPAATVEDMYRPDRHARTGSGRLRVTAKE